MVKLIIKKLAGATLIEVMIAMVIILVVFVIAMKVFVNVLNTGVSYRNIQVQNQLHVLSKKVEELGRIENDFLQIDSVAYEFREERLGMQNLSQLEIKAKQQGKLIGSLKTVFKVKPNAEN